jgi:hypothetical protein
MNRQNRPARPAGPHKARSHSHGRRGDARHPQS